MQKCFDSSATLQLFVITKTSAFCSSSSRITKRNSSELFIARTSRINFPQENVDERCINRCATKTARDVLILLPFLHSHRFSLAFYFVPERFFSFAIKQTSRLWLISPFFLRQKYINTLSSLEPK